MREGSGVESEFEVEFDVVDSVCLSRYRAAVSAVDPIATLARFIAAVSRGRMPEAQSLDAMRNLVRSPGHIRVLGTAGAPDAVGVVIDLCESAANFAELSIFASEGHAAAATRALVPWAEALVREGPRAGVEIPLYPGGPDPSVLAEAGYVFAHALWGMRAVAVAPEFVAQARVAPPGFSWQALTPALVPALHATTRSAFAGVPGCFVFELEAFAERCLVDGPTRRVLTDGTQVIAFVRVACDGDVGTVASLGRAPAWRACGLGGLALAEGLRLLGEAGARTFELEVAARNRVALALYESAGFVCTSELRVVARAGAERRARSAMVDPDHPALIPLPSRLEGARVVVRPFARGDGAALWEAVEASRTELARWLPWPARHQRVDDSEQYVRSAAARWMTREDLAVVLTDRAGRLVGGSGLHGVDWRVRVMEIGYWLRTDAYGAGHATEAVGLLTALAFDVLGAGRVFIRCERDNLRSAALPARLGFVPEAHPPEHRLAVDGSGLVELVEFGLTRAELAHLPWYAEAARRVVAAPLDG